MFEEGVEVLAKMGADALTQGVVQPVEVVFVDQPITKDSQDLVDPQSTTYKLDLSYELLR